MLAFRISGCDEELSLKRRSVAEFMRESIVFCNTCTMLSLNKKFTFAISSADELFVLLQSYFSHPYSETLHSQAAFKLQCIAIATFSSFICSVSFSLPHRKCVCHFVY